MNQKKAFLTIFLVVATELIGFGLIIPILPQIASRFGISGMGLGLLMAAYSMAQFVAAPLLGRLSDKYGRKPILVISKIGTVISYIILAYANSYALFLVSRLLDGFTGGNIATARAYMADITSEKDRSKGMAIIGISFGTGFILGPALGGYFYGVGAGHMAAAFVAGSLSFIALLMTIFILKEPETHKAFVSSLSKLTSFKQVLTNKYIQLISGVQMFYMVIFSGFETTFSVFMFRSFGYNEQQNSFLFMYFGIVALFIQGYLSRKTFKHPERVATFGLFFAAVSLALLGTLTQFSTLLLSLTFLSLGVCVLNVFLPSLLTIHSDPNAKGTVMGIFESIGSFSRIIGPIIAFSPLFVSLNYLYLVYSVGFLLLTSFFFLGYNRPVVDNEKSSQRLVC